MEEENTHILVPSFWNWTSTTGCWTQDEKCWDTTPSRKIPVFHLFTGERGNPVFLDIPTSRGFSITVEKAKNGSWFKCHWLFLFLLLLGVLEKMLLFNLITSYRSFKWLSFYNFDQFYCEVDPWSSSHFHAKKWNSNSLFFVFNLH